MMKNRFRKNRNRSRYKNINAKIINNNEQTNTKKQKDNPVIKEKQGNTIIRLLKIGLSGFCLIVPTIIAVLTYCDNKKHQPLTAEQYDMIMDEHNRVDTLTLLKDSIRNNIAIIQTEFQHDEIEELDKMYDVVMIQLFRNQVMELAAYWEEIESTPSHAFSVDNDADNLNTIVQSWFDKIHIFLQLVKEVFSRISTIKTIGDVYHYERYNPNQAKLLYLESLLESKQKIVDSANLQFNNVMNDIWNFADSVKRANDLMNRDTVGDKAAPVDIEELFETVESNTKKQGKEMEDVKKEMSNIYDANPTDMSVKEDSISRVIFNSVKPKIVKALNYIDGLRNNPDYYKFDYYLFKFLVDLNRMYQIQINEYKSELNKKNSEHTICY